jgi:hypothetical protein
MPSFNNTSYFIKYYYLIYFILINITFSTISPQFSAFINENYGESAEKLLARRDLGPGGSFGGGEFKLIYKIKNHHRPIILVHGLSTFAGEYENIRQHLLLNGYNDNQVFASSYAFGKFNWIKDSMECKHVKLVKYFKIFILFY